MKAWTFIGGPASFGTGTQALASSQTGSIFDFEKLSGTTRVILLPTTYTSGAAISDTETWGNTTLAALGLTPGASFTWNWGSAGDADSFQIDVAGVPEPASLTALSAGIAFLGFTRRRRRGR